MSQTDEIAKQGDVRRCCEQAQVGVLNAIVEG